MNLPNLIHRSAWSTSSLFQPGLSILIFHRVLAKQDPLFPGEMYAQRFAEVLTRLSACAECVPLLDGVRALRNGVLKRPSFAITFDDGYADNAEIALPILQRLGLQATFYISTGYLNGGRMWNDSVIEVVRAAPVGTIELSVFDLPVMHIAHDGDRRNVIDTVLRHIKHQAPAERQQRVDAFVASSGAFLPNNLMMRDAQVRELHQAGMTLGAHTLTHPILAAQDVDAARREIVEGKAALEKITGEPVQTFAYPNGRPHQDYRAEHVQMVKDAGFEFAVSTALGTARAASDPYQLPRFTPWDMNTDKFLLRLAANRLLQQTAESV